MKKETKIVLAIMAITLFIGVLVVVFSRQKSRVINDLLPDADNYDNGKKVKSILGTFTIPDKYDGIKKIKKGTRIYINADDTLIRVTLNNGKIEPAKYFMKNRDFEAGDYVGKYVGKYGEYAHLVQGNNAFKHIYVIHNSRIK